MMSSARILATSASTRARLSAISRARRFFSAQTIFSASARYWIGRPPNLAAPWRAQDHACFMMMRSFSRRAWCAADGVGVGTSLAVAMETHLRGEGQGWSGGGDHPASPHKHFVFTLLLCMLLLLLRQAA